MMKMEAQKAVDINDAICEHVSGTFRLILRYGMSGVVLERLNSIQEYIAIFQRVKFPVPLSVVF